MQEAGRSSLVSSGGTTTLRVSFLPVLRRERYLQIYRLLAVLVGSVLSYVFYWIAVMAALAYMKFKEVSRRDFLFLGNRSDVRRRVERSCSVASPPLGLSEGSRRS